MTCGEVHGLLPSLASEELSAEQARLCHAHLGVCSACTTRLAEHQRLLRLLSWVGETESVPRVLSQGLHLRLAQEPVPKRPLFSSLWPVLDVLRWHRTGLLAAACALAVVLTAPSLWKRSPGASQADGSELAAAFQVPAQRVAVVRIDFVADVEIPEVEFEVTLPSDLQFVDEGQVIPDRTLVWRGSLVSGSNPIPLAVRGVKPGRYRVIARARGAGLAVRHDILLDVVNS